jgi:predicted O-methyltransferase YrrM
VPGKFDVCYIERVNHVLSRILSTNTVMDGRGNVLPLTAHIHPDDGEFLQNLVRQLRPRHSLEIGFAYGISTLFICDALAETGLAEKHIVCDPIQMKYWGGIGLKNVRDAGHGDLLDFRPLKSYVLLPQLEQSEVRVQFAFIDGYHTFDYVLVDFFFIDRILDVGGIVVFDDADMPSIRKVLRYILAHRRYAVVGKGEVHPPSWRRRAAEVVASLPGVRRLAGADVIVPDYKLGITARVVALRKEGEDLLGDGTEQTRRWDQHFDF